jgi:tetratricopeptide (TPR) repeat protein
MTTSGDKIGKERDLKVLGKEAHRLTKQGRYKEAEEKYALVLKADSSNVYALVGLGDLKRKKKEFQGAIAYYQRALDVDKDNKYALTGLGDAYRGLREVDKALDLWLRYLSLNPYDYKVMTRVADGFRRKGDYGQSKKYYFMAVKEKPNDPFALMGLGDIFAREGNDEESLKYFERLICISDGKPDDSIMALTSAANIYRKQGQYEKAMDCYERVLKINPQNSYAWHGKADCFRGLRDYLSAIKAWRMALEHGMDPRIAITRIGNAYMSLKDLFQAEESYNQALSFGYDKYAYLGMTRIHDKRNEIDKALEIFSMLVEREPNDSRIISEFKSFLEKHPEVEVSAPPLRR